MNKLKNFSKKQLLKCKNMYLNILEYCKDSLIPTYKKLINEIDDELFYRENKRRYYLQRIRNHYEK